LEEIIIAYAEVKKVARLDPREVVIGILSAWRWDLD
jgi:hypothetical protein